MVTKRTKPAGMDQVAPELSVTRDEAKTKLEDRIEKGRELRNIAIASHEGLESARNAYRKWDAFNGELLMRLFTAASLADEYRKSSSTPVIMMAGYGPTLGEEISELKKKIDTKIHRIDSIIDRLELIPLAVPAQQQVADRQSETASKKSNKVFVVHGRDDVSKTNLEVFLHENGLEPVVLHRQADEGKTIIEKFEKHSDVGYAFILLTPDEIAYLASDDDKDDKDRTKEYRARPNVIFEFGYFVAKLSRSKVCCLYTGDVTLPSDVSGMIYKKFTSSIDEVAYSIIKDLRAAGYSLK